MSNKDDIASRLAAEHFAVEPGITCIHRLVRSDGNEDAPTEPVKLLEVNEGTIATGIQPLQFAPAKDRGIPYSSVIIEVTPEEFEQIQRGGLRLPSQWKIGNEIPRPTLPAGIG